VQSHRPGVMSASLFGVRYSSPSLDQSSGLKDDCPDPEAVAEGMTLLLSMLSGLLTGTRQYLA